MDNKILFKILVLDSIYHFLDWTERVRIHLYMHDKTQSTTPEILTAYEWIISNDWQAPHLKYGDDRLLYFESKPNVWTTIEDYQCENINQLKK